MGVSVCLFKVYCKLVHRQSKSYIGIQCGTSLPVRRLSLSWLSGACRCMAAVSCLRRLWGRVGAGGVVSQRGGWGDAALCTSSSHSLWVWRIMRAVLTSRWLSSPPSAGSAAAAGADLSVAVAGQDRR